MNNKFYYMLNIGKYFLFIIYFGVFYSKPVKKMLNLENFAAFFLFFLECYHICGHLNVLFRIRLLPRRDLVRIRFYFLFDLLTVFASSFLFLHRLQWLAAVQIVQHLYYFMYWEKTAPAKKVHAQNYNNKEVTESYYNIHVIFTITNKMDKLHV